MLTQKINYQDGTKRRFPNSDTFGFNEECARKGIWGKCVHEDNTKDNPIDKLMKSYDNSRNQYCENFTLNIGKARSV